MSLTHRQKEALASDRHIVLRAGAGSGKTLVLTERYLNLIGNGSATVEHILALTFTEKAAREMKDRVRREVIDKLNHFSSINDRDQLLFWEKVRDQLGDAHISTIHSFCASLLREMPIESGVDPKYRIIEDFEQTQALKDAIATAMTNALNENAESIITLSEQWSRKEIAEAILLLFFDRFRNIQWAERILTFTEDELLLRHKLLAEQWLYGAVSPEWIDETISSLTSLVCLDKSDRAYEQYLRAIEGLESLKLSFGRGTTPDFSFTAQLNKRAGSTKKWADGDLDEWKSYIDTIRNKVKLAKIFVIGNHDRVGVIMLKALADIFLKSAAEYLAVKGHGALLDFDDLQENTLRLFQNSSAAADVIRNRFRFIMIDEFQDTDPMQWELISLLAADANGSLKNNVFIVGDDKQSIYSFRGADVRVFSTAEKELDASNRRALNCQDTSIELDINFRSHVMLMKFYNELFGSIFAPHETSEANIKYNAIAPGRSDALAATCDRPRVEILCLPLKEELPDELSRFQYEAESAARRIRAMLDNSFEYPVYDNDKKEIRPLDVSDIAVLFPTRTHLSEYEEAFRRYGIPFMTVGGIGFYDRQEVLDLINLLSFLSDGRDEISLVGILRSPFVGLSDETLFRISTMKGRTFFDKMTAYTGTDSDLIAGALNSLTRWTTLSKYSSVSGLLSDILEESGAWGVYAAGLRGAQSIRNIEKFIDMARDYERNERGGLRSFLNFQKERIENADRTPEALNSRAVEGHAQFMTVHAAKGLEFPLVIIASISGEYRNPGKSLLLSDDIPQTKAKDTGTIHVGIKTGAFQDGSYGIKPTVMYEILKDTKKNRLHDEEERLLYVACTRAREYLIISGFRSETRSETSVDPSKINSWDKEIMAAINRSVNPNIFSDLILWSDHMPECNAPRITGLADNIEQFRNALQMDVSADEHLNSGKPDVLMYYGVCDERESSLEIAATAVQTFAHDRAEYLNTNILGIPLSWIRSRGAQRGSHKRHPDVEATVRGEAVHKVFESLPWHESDSREILTNALIALHVSDEKTRESLINKYIPKLESFKKSDIGKMILHGPSFTEMPFVLSIGSHIIRGKMDCIFDDTGVWHIIDYKTDNIDKMQAASAADKYRLQLEIYALAALKSFKDAPCVKASLFFIEIDYQTPPIIVKHEDTAGLEAKLETILNQLDDYERISER